jgi:hypothetical protein
MRSKKAEKWLEGIREGVSRGSYLFLKGIVGVGLSELDQLDTLLVQVVEMVRRIRDFISTDFKQFKIFNDRLLKLGLHDEFTPLAPPLCLKEI